MSSDTGALAPACTKCRSHRVKCDRTRPICGRCVRLGHHCEYPIRNPATAYVNYVSDLESQIAVLERQLQGARGHELGISPQVGNPDRLANEPNDFSMSSPTHPDHLISDLFTHTDNSRDWDSKVKTLVDDLAQVSLSAMTSQGAAPAHDLALRTLMLGAAMPSRHGHKDDQSRLPILPNIDIAEKVCTRYCKDLLPDMPCFTVLDVQQHMKNAYHDSNHYSIFVVATILATTAIFLSPGSTESAVDLYTTGVQFLEGALAAGHQRDPLQELEAVVALAQFAILSGTQYANSWALSGLAVRIAVDLGLHKVCDTDKKQRLFWAAYMLDRKCAINTGRPVGISDGAIDTPLPLAQNIFELYRMMSEAYTLQQSPSRQRAESLVRRLDAWVQDYQTQRVPSRLIDQDVASTKSLLHSYQ